MLVRDIMKLKPQEDDTRGLSEGDYDSITLMQEDRFDELCYLSIPPVVDGADVVSPDDEDDILPCKYNVGEIREAIARNASLSYSNYETGKKDAITAELIKCLINFQVYYMGVFIEKG